MADLPIDPPAIKIKFISQNDKTVFLQAISEDFRYTHWKRDIEIDKSDMESIVDSIFVVKSTTRHEKLEWADIRK